MEKRVLNFSNLRSIGVGDKKSKKSISGYAARYGILSRSLGQFKEQIAKRAFDKVLKTNPDCVALVNHNQSQVIGRTTSGTLKLTADDQGLHFDCSLPNTSYANDLHELVRRGDMAEASFAFTVDDSTDCDWSQDEERGLIRTIHNFKGLHDISVVTNAAYPNTSVDARMTTVISAEVRSYVAKVLRLPLSQRFLIGLPQAEIDALVENRDLDRYPLSNHEVIQLRKRRLALLENF
jgi:Escherichia/Staphylococcus phage prohead protease